MNAEDARKASTANKRPPDVERHIIAIDKMIADRTRKGMFYIFDVWYHLNERFSTEEKTIIRKHFESLGFTWWEKLGIETLSWELKD